ncbi:MAG: 30S ribosomal protein S9 [Acidimicrobiales bacterium]
MTTIETEAAAPEASEAAAPEAAAPESPAGSEPDAVEGPSAGEADTGAPAAGPDSRPPAKPRGKPLVQATGRRKSAVARVRLRHGNGVIVVNGRRFEDYFPSATHRMVATEPLRVIDAAEDYDVHVTMDGGGISGQAGALRLGIARGLVAIDPELRVTLKRAGLLTRDAREKESKKYGLKKARKAPQYSKR